LAEALADFAETNEGDAARVDGHFLAHGETIARNVRVVTRLLSCQSCASDPLRAFGQNHFEPVARMF
jgi:hypothetical protein